MELCQTHDIPFILNDRIELAISLKTQGLHVGKKQDDAPYSLEELKQIRSSFNGILGVSCYGDLNLARNAKLAKVDYIAFGSCFNSPTKPNAKTIPLDIFTQAKHLEIPMCAIGGIQKENITQIQNVQMAACISSIWQGNVKRNTQELSKKFKQGQEWI